MTPLFLTSIKKGGSNNMTDLTVNIKDFSAFYPGAGLDIAPIVLFPHIKEWYYMDSQPVSEFGSTIFPGCERPRFIERLKNIMGQIGMDCMLHTDHFLLFLHPKTQCKVTYYVNAVFPKALEYCYLPCNVFVACGFDLKHRPPQFMSRWTHIITNNKTYNEDWMQEWKHAQVSTIVWDEVEDEFLDENRKVEFIMKHTRIYKDVCEKAVFCHF